MTYAFTRRADGQTVYAAHINELQAAIETLDEARLYPQRDTTTQTTTATLTSTSARTQYLDGTGGAFTVNLPAAATVPGAWFECKRIDAGTGAITLDGNGGETIDGETTVRLYGRVSVLIVSDGANWRVLHGRDHLHPFATTITPDWFGAKADGSTDDQTAIQAAYTVANAISGHTVRYKRGRTYIVGAQITNYGNVHSDFNGATIKVKDGSTAFNVFVSGNVSNVSYADGVIDLNKANTTGGGLTSGLGIYWAPTSGNTYGHRAERMRVLNGRGVGIRLTSQTAVTDAADLVRAEVTLRDVEVTGCLLSGVMLQGVTDSVLDRVVSWGNTTDGISIYMALRTIATHCHATANGGHGIVWQYARGGGSFNCEGASNGGDGIVYGGGNVGYTPSRDFGIVGCHTYDNDDHGVSIDPTITTGTLELTHATVSALRTHDNGIHGLYLQNVEHVTLDGIESYGNTQSGIAVHGKWVSFGTAHSHDNGSYGIDLQGEASTTPAPGAHVLGSSLNLHDNTAGSLALSTYLVDVDGAFAAKTHDWPDLASGAEQTTTVTVYGAALGMTAEASMSVSLAGTKLVAYVSAANTVTVVQRNDTGGNVNLASGTLRAKVRRAG